MKTLTFGFCRMAGVLLLVVAFSCSLTGAFADKVVVVPGACADTGTPSICAARGGGAPGIPSTCISLPDPCVVDPNWGGGSINCGCRQVPTEAWRCNCIGWF